jgi:hypothetical protein
VRQRKVKQEEKWVIQKRKVKLLAYEPRHSQAGHVYCIVDGGTPETIPEIYSQANTRKN